ncbi:peptidoglycan DD-metalloendopeptidase family protein [Alicyclobacillus ferrooxydans]|uniref:peptidoglycan DD-metalloendopeptidase family protein n=1 Tax=Alicyclobacillus ferrooxydans TaxID=471514 RepID=UPI0006D590DC|nr:peptidoglycan DD-metalloendopeptidase family protein [Alicyclobacillus ferrooxydans]
MELTQRLQSLKRLMTMARQRKRLNTVTWFNGSSNDKSSERSNGSNVRLYAATIAAGMLLIGGSYLAIDRIQSTQPWVRVFSNGNYMGMIPDDRSVVASLNRTAKAYHVSINLSPVHTHVDSGYNWGGVAALPTEATAIRYNGQPLVYVSSRAQAASVLRQVRNALVPKGVSGSRDVHFVGKVDVAPAVVSVTSLLDTSAAIRSILHPEINHLAGRSVSLSWLAPQSGISGFASKVSSGFHSNNPPVTFGVSYNVNTISGIADTSNAHPENAWRDVQAKASHGALNGPLLSVQAMGTITKDLALPYAVHYIQSPDLGLGAVKVVRQGQPGKVKENVAVTYVNGTAVAEKVLSKKVLEPPRPEVVDKGTNAGIASGSWNWPTDNYDITSGFGWRILGGRPNFHPGKDIGVPIGSPVYATNNGVVIQAGWNAGGYGNWVMINNGHGIETVFGHMSKVLVHVGQTVAKGELIGRSGDTGFSTGPHLHYEVRLNGVPVDPAKYM